MRRTAIIAVHGVGSPPRFDTARGIADLLTQYGCCSDTCSYPSFHEQQIKIPTSPVITPEITGGRDTPDKKLGHDRTKFVDADPIAAEHLDIAFMRDQLLGYEDESKRVPYNTIEIIGCRVHDGPNGRVEEEVRIYEMHWADLSRVGTGVLRLLGALYQLILHLGHLGRKTLDLASAATARQPGAEDVARHWKRVASSHAWALRFFTIGVPVFSLLLLACVALFLPDAIAPRRRLLIGVLMLEIGLLVGIGVRTYFRDRATNAAGRLVTWILMLVTAGVLVVLFAARLGGNSLGVAVLNSTTVLLVLLVYLAILKQYNTAAPGAFWCGIAGLVIVVVGALSWGPRFRLSAGEAAGEGLRFTALAGFQFGYILLMGVWVLIWGAALLTTVNYFRLRWSLSHSEAQSREDHSRAKRAMWTAKVTLALSLFSLIVTALVGYEALNQFAWRVHSTPPELTQQSVIAPGVRADTASGFNIYPSLPPGSAFPLITKSLVRPDTTCPPPPPGREYDSSACSKHFFDSLIAQSGTAGLPIALGAAGLALLLISWFIVLIAVTSLRVPKSESVYARNVGDWVTDGFRWTHAAGTVMVFGFATALSVGLFFALWRAAGSGTETWLTTQTTSDILVWLALAALATAATLAAARARIELAASRARPAIGIVLDVDNYLRESPKTATPKAMIAERFASVLRHVVERKASNGTTPYFDRIVIVSHSQGTVISADLLRYLTIAKVASPNLATVDLRLLTMGCPLRQLYSVHFPHLYSWVDRTDYVPESGRREDRDFAARAHGLVLPSGADGQVLTTIRSATTVTSSLDEMSPSPRWLRVRQWVNLFTAGDYVGRPLWQNDSSPNVWKLDEHAAAAVGDGRRERCLGDGTHTRYWTSLDVAREIDDLIAL